MDDAHAAPAAAAGRLDDYRIADGASDADDFGIVPAGAVGTWHRARRQPSSRPLRTPCRPSGMDRPGADENEAEDSERAGEIGVRTGAVSRVDGLGSRVTLAG